MYCAAPGHTVEACPILKQKPRGESLSIRQSVTSHSMQPNYITICLTLQWDQKRINVNALVNTGATGNFIDTTTVSCNKIPFMYKRVPVSVRVIDDTVLNTGPVTKQTQPILTIIRNNHRELISFDIISSPRFPIILGLPWLLTHKPTILWESLSLQFNSLYCKETCLFSLDTYPAYALNNAETKHLIPPSYMDFSDVFSKKNAEALPPHRTYDCPIELLPDSKIPFGHIYPLSQPELVH